MCNSCHPQLRGPTRRSLVLCALPAALAASGMLPRLALAGATTVNVPAPKPEDTCPVCGMFVAKYPYWIATVLFKDGHADHFDGGKDFFKYLLDMKKYARGRTREQIAVMGVTGYYDTRRIDAKQAVYVIGSDVLGPMGHELVPLADDAEAKEFLGDHKGRRTLRFGEVTMALLDGLDQGTFE